MSFCSSHLHICELFTTPGRKPNMLCRRAHFCILSFRNIIFDPVVGWWEVGVKGVNVHFNLKYIVVLHFHTNLSCYPAACSFALPHKYVMLRCWMFSCTSTRIRHATPLDVLLYICTISRSSLAIVFVNKIFSFKKCL